MLRLSCSLDANKEGILREREIEAGGHFDVALIAEHVGNGSKSTVFDTIILEILYNDKNYVLFTDPKSHPIAGEIVHGSSRDAFSLEPLTPGKRSDPASPFSNGSLLTLRPPSGDFSGPYKSATGRAGITAPHDKPFEVHQGRPSILMPGRIFTLAETAGGTSSLVISAHVFRGSSPVATESAVSTIKVVPRAGRKAFDVE